MADYYSILGVPRGAGAKEIRQAFRKSARRYHPDLNPGDRGAEKKFKEINEAHEVLSVPENRKKYDRYGDNWKHADQIESRFRGGGTADDLGSDLFGGLDDLLGRATARAGRRARAATMSRLETSVTVSLEDALSGSIHYVTISSTEGQRRIEVTVPAGVDTGSVVHVSLDKGTDLFLKVTVSPHPRFERKGADLYTEVQVPFEDAILGGETEVHPIKGRLQMKVPSGSQNGQKIRLAGQGMPELGSPEARGDLYVTLRPTLPTDPTDEERELLLRLKELRSKRR